MAIENDIIPFPDGYYELIGRITVRWSAFIRLVDAYCIFLGDVNGEAGFAFTQNISSLPGKRSTFYSLIQIRGCSADTIKALKHIFKRAQKLQEKRNSLMHGVWTFSKEMPGIVRQHHKLQNGAPQRTGIHQDMKNLHKLYGDMEVLVRDFQHTFEGALKQLQPLR